MPTTIPLISSATPLELSRGDSPAIKSNPDLLAVAVFFVIGLGLTIGNAWLFPLAANAAVPGWTT
jgi:hypothetical protein